MFVLVEVFDATGTLIGVAKRAKLIEEGKPNNLGRALFADSTAIVAGSLIGTSSTTAYVESASGVQAGGRTGLTALTIAVLFLAALFFSPLAGAVPAYATAPALLYVAGLMMRELVEIDWEDVTEATPAALTAIAMPFTYSIANGLAFGFISYVVLKLATGRCVAASIRRPGWWRRCSSSASRSSPSDWQDMFQHGGTARYSAVPHFFETPLFSCSIGCRPRVKKSDQATLRSSGAKGLSPSQACMALAILGSPSSFHPAGIDLLTKRGQSHPDRGHRAQRSRHQQIDLEAGIEAAKIDRRAVDHQPPIALLVGQFGVQKLNRAAARRQRLGVQVAAHVPHQERRVEILQRQLRFNPALAPDAHAQDDRTQVFAGRGQPCTPARPDPRARSRSRRPAPAA